MCVSASYVGDLDGVPLSRLWPGLVLAVAGKQWGSECAVPQSLPPKVAFLNAEDISIPLKL